MLGMYIAHATCIHSFWEVINHLINMAFILAMASMAFMIFLVLLVVPLDVCQLIFLLRVAMLVSLVVFLACVVVALFIS